MSILQVTPNGVTEHVTMPNEERHPRLNTIEALRFIGGLARAEREHFDSMIIETVEKNDKGESTIIRQADGKRQELYMTSQWTARGEFALLAGHNASRALQSVRHFIMSNLVELQEEQPTKRFYFPLLDTPQNPDVANLHWDTESRFRRGLGPVVANILEVSEFNLPTIERGHPVSDQARSFEYRYGNVALKNEVAAIDETVLGSSYVFTVR